MGHKLLFSFLAMFVGVSILGAIMEGGGGIVSTTLAADISENATFIPATSTALFADSDIITIDEEMILYTSLNSSGFHAHTRGYSDTRATAHKAGAKIYTQEASVINNALGFNVAVEIKTAGAFAIFTIPLKFFTHTLPHLIMLNVGFLDIPELNIIGIIWLVAGISLAILLAIQIGQVMVSVVGGIASLVRRR